MFTLTTVGYMTVCAVLALPFTPLLFASTRGRWLGAFESKVDC